VTALLIGLAIGLFAAVVVAGYRHGRTIYTQAFDNECDQFGCHSPSESDGLDIPHWVNNGASSSFFEEFVEAVHIAQWEQELEDPA